MMEREITGELIVFDDEGYMAEPVPWNREIAAVLADDEGIELTDRHFVVLDFMRKDFTEKGTAPSIRRLGKFSGVTVKELYQLFPGGPAKKAARIAGLGKPKGCV
jgi:dissimilatory sulfite reductase related protein